MAVSYYTRKIAEQFEYMNWSSITSSDFNFSPVYDALSMNGTIGAVNNVTDELFNHADSRYSPSMAIIIIVLLSAFFLMGLFSVYVRRCTTQQNLADSNGRRLEDSLLLEEGSPGLDSEIVNQLPVLTYKTFKRLKSEKHTSECAVCLSSFESDDELRVLPNCGHAFHQECIDMWLFSHTNCPLCRQDAEPDNTEGSLCRLTCERIAHIKNQESTMASELDGMEIPVTEGDVATADKEARIKRNEKRMRELILKFGSQSGIKIGNTAHPKFPAQVFGDPSTPSEDVSGKARLLRSHTISDSPFKSISNQSSPEESSLAAPFCLPLLPTTFSRSRSYMALSDRLKQLEHEDTTITRQAGTDRLHHGTAKSDMNKPDIKWWKDFSFRRSIKMQRSASVAREAQSRASILEMVTERH